MKKIFFICLPIIILAIISGLLFLNAQRAQTSDITSLAQLKQKCPDDYGNDDAGSAEYMVAMDKWTNDFFDAHPGATLSDWSRARHQFWVDNNCTAALQRYEDAKAFNADHAATQNQRQ